MIDSTRAFFAVWIFLLLSGVAAAQAASEAAGDRLPAYQARFGRTRPVVTVVAENYYTELTDFVIPYGILSASGAADVLAVATRPGPIRMFPARVSIEPQETTAEFDREFSDGADYVIVPAVHRDDDVVLLAWVAAQARKGATIVGICDGAWVLAHAGLLDRRKATGHWHSLRDLRKEFTRTDWQDHRRYIADGHVITTSGVTAAIPVSLALVEAIAGRSRALDLAATLGATHGWSARHASERFHLGGGQIETIALNFLSFWSHEDLGIEIRPGVDEIALALEAEAWSATYRSTAFTVAGRRDPVRGLHGPLIVPERLETERAHLRMLPEPETARPLRALDLALKDIASDYGERTARWVAIQMEYPAQE